MLSSQIFLAQPTMATFPVRKTVMTSMVVVSTAFSIIGCSHTSHHAEHSADAGIADADSANADSANAGSVNADSAIASTTASTTEAASDHSAHGDHPKGVNTNHDVFHSKSLEVPAGTPVPAVSVRVEEDAVRGWNLYVGTANFDFEPTKVNGESLPTEGHGHLYINDESAQRIYGAWTHLPTLPGGENEIRVTLNANNHESLTTQGEPIEDSVMVEVYAPEQPEASE